MRLLHKSLCSLKTPILRSFVFRSSPMGRSAYGDSLKNKISSKWAVFSKHAVLCNSLNLYWKSRLFLWLEQGKVIRRFYLSSWRYAAIDIALQFSYLFSNPYRICRRYFQEKGEKNIHAYGETPLTLWATIAILAQMTPEDKFLDLGSGRGRLCFWTRHWIGCPTMGIDWVPQFIQKSNRLAQLFGLTYLSFSLSRMTQADLQQATVIYLYTFHPDEETLDFSALRGGTRVITVSEPISQSGFKAVQSIPAVFPWGQTEIFVNLKI